MIDTILAKFNISSTQCTISALSNGLINNTWKINVIDDRNYILQKINHHVFLHPIDIDQNICLVGKFLAQHFPDYLFIQPIVSDDAKTLVRSTEGDYYRLFPFINDSITHIIPLSENHAYEAAKQFALFSKLLANFPVEKLKETLPQFHDLNLRFVQFEHALEKGNQQRVSENSAFVKELYQLKNIIEIFNQIRNNPEFKIRVMHHDTKISNVLFDINGKALCVIDLDTVMPGYFISDFGDMIRTYTCTVSEDETDFSKLDINLGYFNAIVKGYVSEMGDELTETELRHLVYAGKFMIYMQTLRFFTDYLNNDVYYGKKYELHNLNRAINQFTLLKKLIEKEPMLASIIEQSL